MTITVPALRRAAVTSSLPPAADLLTVIRRLGCVQADPIAAPAPAQDLILRQRAAEYRAGDLERLYPDMPIDEDSIHVYGFLPTETRALLYPRERRWQVEDE